MLPQIDQQALQLAVGQVTQFTDQGAKYIGAGLAAIGMLGAGAGIGSAASGALTALGRNPEARDLIVPNMILAFAFAESIAIYGLVVAILLLFVV